MARSAPVLVADIGGTFSRFAVVDDDAVPGEPAACRTLENDRYPDLGAAIAAYLAEADVRPGRAVLAVAGPVDGDRVTLTNRDWSFSAAGLARDHGFSSVEVVNDFAALARALPLLRPDELTPVGAAVPRADRTKLAVGPGTGLGVSALLHHEGRWIAVASEAGHVGFAAVNAREAELFAILRRRLGRIAAETVISGTGLANLDGALAVLNGGEEPLRDPAVIVAAAVGGEARAREAIDLLLAMLARFAGDMALAFLARGGVYFAGGVLAHLAPFIEPDSFRAQFADQNPYGELLADIATVVVAVDDQPALRGCAAIAADRARR
jgi:glucokinase